MLNFFVVKNLFNAKYQCSTTTVSYYFTVECGWYLYKKTYVFQSPRGTRPPRQGLESHDLKSFEEKRHILGLHLRLSISLLYCSSLFKSLLWPSAFLVVCLSDSWLGLHTGCRLVRQYRKWHFLAHPSPLLPQLKGYRHPRCPVVQIVRAVIGCFSGVS